jgi:hypothetical protein
MLVTFLLASIFVIDPPALLLRIDAAAKSPPNTPSTAPNAPGKGKK